MYPQSILAMSESLLVSNGYIHHIYCGMTQIWTHCRVCKKYSFMKPFGKGLDIKWVCENCKCASQLVG